MKHWYMQCYRNQCCEALVHVMLWEALLGSNVSTGTCNVMGSNVSIGTCNVMGSNVCIGTCNIMGSSVVKHWYM